MSDTPLIVDGIKVNITIDDIDDIEIAEAMEEGRFATAMKMTFGDEEYNRIKEAFKEKNGGRAKLSEIAEWFQNVSEKLGADTKN